jgi:hypothetical protein
MLANCQTISSLTAYPGVRPGLLPSGRFHEIGVICEALACVRQTSASGQMQPRLRQAGCTRQNESGSRPSRWPPDLLVAKTAPRCLPGSQLTASIQSPARTQPAAPFTQPQPSRGTRIGRHDFCFDSTRWLSSSRSRTAGKATKGQQDRAPQSSARLRLLASNVLARGPGRPHPAPCRARGRHARDARRGIRAGVAPDSVSGSGSDCSAAGSRLKQARDRRCSSEATKEHQA